MLDFVRLPPLLSILYWTIGVVCAIYLVFTIRGFVLDYGFSPRRWLRGYHFAYLRKLLWWQRMSPMFYLDTRLYVGLPGSGKTLLLTQDAITFLRAGIRVLSNFRIVDPLTGKSSIVIKSWYDMLAYSVAAVGQGVPTVFIIDEIHLWAPARMWAKTPGWWLGLMAQRRHFGIGVYGSCQSFSQVEKGLRILTDWVVFVHPLVPVRLFGRSLPFFMTEEVPAQSMNDSGESMCGADRQIRLVKWHTYAGYNTAELVAVEEWSEDEDISERIAALTRAAQSMTLIDEFEHLDGTYRPSLDPQAVNDLVATLLDGMESAA